MNQQVRPQEFQPPKVPGGEVQPEALPPEQGVVLTPEQLRSRRARNIALGLAIGLFALLFYAVTIAKLIHFGPGTLDRPI